eukprot:7166169-Pyramimonas_sp.AAC.1
MRWLDKVLIVNSTVSVLSPTCRRSIHPLVRGVHRRVGVLYTARSTGSIVDVVRGPVVFRQYDAVGKSSATESRIVNYLDRAVSVLRNPEGATLEPLDRAKRIAIRDSLALLFPTASYCLKTTGPRTTSTIDPLERAV